MPNENSFFNGYLTKAIGALDNAGASLMEVPEGDRHKLLELENRITSETSISTYMKLVNSWKNTILKHQPKIEASETSSIEAQKRKELKSWEKQQHQSKNN